MKTSHLKLLSLCAVLALAAPAWASPGAGNQRGRAGASSFASVAFQSAHTPGDRVLVAKVPLLVVLGISPYIFKVATRVYVPVGRTPRNVVQILVHGATYDGRYWEIPSIDGESYSYAEHMAELGYAVVVIDQLGAGQSSKPNGDAFGLAQAAQVLDQVEHEVRFLAGPQQHIVYVGHSNGSVTAIDAQGLYGSADALVTTGWDHCFRPLPVDPTDPALQAALATPYVSLPGVVRAGLFYYAPETDPAVIAYDNAQLDNAMPRKQFLDLLAVHGDITARGPGGMTPLTHALEVRVPVLVQAGEDDFAIAPASVLDAPPTEAAFYANSPSFTEQKLPDIGHAYNGHLTRAESWDGIDAWLSQTFP